MRGTPIGPPPDLDPRREWRLGTGGNFISTLAAGTAPNLWQSYTHGNQGYVLYMHDQLSQAVKAIERAMRGHAFPEWLSQLLYVTAGELEARDFCRRVERPPFVYELPPDGPDGLIDLTEAHAARVESLLSVERQPTLFTFLPPGSLAEMTDSPHGYMVPKLPYFKVCLPYEAGDTPDDLASGLVHEYVHVVEAELSQGQTPRWVAEGLAQWAEGELTEVDDLEEPVLLPGEHPRLERIEGLFNSGRSVDEDEMDYAYAAALSAVRFLLDRHGPANLRMFLVRLPEEPAARAFRGAFDESLRAFEQAWHQWLRENPVEAEWVAG